MIRVIRILALALATAVFATPQELAPGTVLLSRIHRHVEQQLKDLQNYTCLETVHRFHKPPNQDWSPRFSDTFRTEILYVGTREMYSAPGERNFHEGGIAAYVNTGMSQEGLFGGYLHNVLVAGAARYTYRGEENFDGRRAAKFDYVISSFDGPLTLVLAGFGPNGPPRKGITGVKGTFWADPESLDVLRLIVQADDIPGDLAVASSVSELTYALVRIGERDIMIAQTADSSIELVSGQADRNILELTHCRAFEAESSISFGPPEPVAEQQAPRFGIHGADFTAASQPVDAGLRVVMTLSSAVNATTPAGTPIEARVLVPPPTTKGGKAAPSKGSKTPVSDGAIVHGRVRRIARLPAGDGVTIALEFCDVNDNGTRQRFYADLESADRLQDVETVLTTGPPRLEGPPDLPGVANFVVHGDRVELPAGFRLVWKTRTLD